MLVDDFFRFGRLRHRVYLRRASGQPYPWTINPILNKYRFTNVYRELDRTTVWFRENIREPLRSSPDVLLATVVFRWFNRIETGDALFLRNIPQRNITAFQAWRQGEGPQVLQRAILGRLGAGPYITGAYIVKSPNGMNKLDGVIWACDQFLRTSGWEDRARALLSGSPPRTLQATWEWLRRAEFQGAFTAYEVVSDLRHTDMLCDAPDIMTWANPGPGAMRGLNRLHGRDLKSTQRRELYIAEMRELLDMSRNPALWPQEPDWPPWEMREVEHWLCEFSKQQRVLYGGTMKGRYP